MVKKASTRLYVLNKRLSGKTYSATMLYLPSKVVNDSAFPLRKKGRLIVKIVGDKLVVENEKTVRRKH
ncbi:MAG: hypothetical protein FGF51_00965 [Candidatus Brockarchaeota archaeon]|nr:hypothetical protein [Candidatus Brockarchaeota archaeon]